jgi:parallel beta-helix repeat protein
MSNVRVRIVLGLLWCVAAGPLCGATYFVSPSGSDASAGTSDAPWQTLQHAADHVGAGDFVTVRPGTYVGFVLGWDFPQNGASGNPITFHAEPGTLINTRNAKTPDGINLEGASWVVIEGFTVSGLPRTGIRSVTNTGVVIRKNVLDSNGTWGILTGFSDNITIEDNIASRSGTQHGIYVSNSCVNPVVRRNVIFGNYAAGLHMNGDLSQGGPGLITGALVERNIIFDNGRGGGSGINCDGVQSSVFRNNLLYNNHASGISLYRIDAADGATNNLVVNNTIVVASDGRWAVNIKNGSTGNTLRNNILYNYHSFRGSINVLADSLSGFTSDTNALMDRFSTDDGSSILTLAGWQAATGQDQHSLLSTPAALFKTNDYHLAPASPAIDTGTAMGAPAIDLEGNPRPAGAGFDIGAYEANAGTATSFFPLTPCRLLDTRNPNGPLGGPALVAGARRTFTVAGACGIPPMALSISVNVTVATAGAAGMLVLFAGNDPIPGTSTISFSSGRTRANNALLRLATDGTGSFSVQNGAAGPVPLIVDVNGYFQ